MKKLWIGTIFFAILATLLRIAQLMTGFDDDGLALPGNLPGLALPPLLAAGLVLFTVLAQRLPAQRDVAGGLGECFPLHDSLAAAMGIGGAFLSVAGAALQFLSMGYSALSLVLAAVALLSAAAVLYVIFALFRGTEVQGLALLIPVCYLVLRLILLYREDAAEPVLAMTYPELLALAALTLCNLERSAFAFRNGAPRLYIPAASMAVVLSFAAATGARSDLGKALLFLGYALVEMAFLSAADFDTAS